jgi:hypothetical protein
MNVAGQVYYNNFRHDASHMRLALSAFSRALEISPSSSSALFSLARVTVDLCKWDAWIETFEQVRLGFKDLGFRIETSEQVRLGFKDLGFRIETSEQVRLGLDV